MIINLNGKKLFIDQDRACNLLKERMNAGLGQEFKLPNGPTIDLRKNSLLTVGIRQLFSLFIPFLMWMAGQVGIDLPKKEKHGDVIKYTINAYFLIMTKVASDSTVDVTTGPLQWTDEPMDEIKSIQFGLNPKADIPLPFLNAFKK